MGFFDRCVALLESKVTVFAANVSARRYCTRCDAKISEKSVAGTLGWCGDCNDTVDVSRCKVSYWAIAAVMTLSLLQPFSLWPI